MPQRYIPKRGDFVHLTFDPQSGHEQKGRRPALIISHELFNRATGLAIVCPITNTNKNIPFHIEIPTNKNITGFIMVEQVKSIDFKARKVQKISVATQEILEQVLGILDACIY
jgi:mRNA interferase MazF